MTTAIRETGTVHKCGSCRKKTVATSHNGNIVLRSGKQVVFAPTLSVTCPGCGHVNHLSIAGTTNVVD